MTPGEAERNIQIIFQICFAELLGSERLLSSLTALTINLCLPDYSFYFCFFFFKPALAPPPPPPRVQTSTLPQVSVDAPVCACQSNINTAAQIYSQSRFCPGISLSCDSSCVEAQKPLSKARGVTIGRPPTTARTSPRSVKPLTTKQHRRWRGSELALERPHKVPACFRRL